MQLPPAASTDQRFRFLVLQLAACSNLQLASWSPCVLSLSIHRSSDKVPRPTVGRSMPQFSPSQSPSISLSVSLSLSVCHKKHTFINYTAQQTTLTRRQQTLLPATLFYMFLAVLLIVICISDTHTETATHTHRQVSYTCTKEKLTLGLECCCTTRRCTAPHIAPSSISVPPAAHNLQIAIVIDVDGDGNLLTVLSFLFSVFQFQSRITALKSRAII